MATRSGALPPDTLTGASKSEVPAGPVGATSLPIIQELVGSVRTATWKTAVGGNPAGKKGTTNAQPVAVGAQAIGAVRSKPVSMRMPVGVAVGVAVAVRVAVGFAVRVTVGLEVAAGVVKGVGVAVVVAAGEDTNVLAAVAVVVGALNWVGDAAGTKAVGVAVGVGVDDGVAIRDGPASAGQIVNLSLCTQCCSSSACSIAALSPGNASKPLDPLPLQAARLSSIQNQLRYRRALIVDLAQNGVAVTSTFMKRVLASASAANSSANARTA